MNKIIVYEHCNFEGLSKDFTSDIPDLIKLNFNDCISSLKVIGNPWVAYTGANFTGEPTVYEEGEYASVQYNDDISSLQLVTEALDNPQITLYEEENYKGQSLVLDCETNLCYGDFNDKASSHKVQRGAWVLYQHGQRVEKGSSNTKTTSESIRVSMPASIPPRTKLTVNVVRKEMTVVIPVKLTITNGSHTKVEYGEYQCEQGNSISTVFKEEKV
ncbi:epidermal differentiation-specific protein-like [Tachysurus ichikawai]